MATLEEKQLAKELLIEMVRKDYLHRSEYPNTATVVEMCCLSYEEILNTISKP